MSFFLDEIRAQEWAMHPAHLEALASKASAFVASGAYSRVLASAPDPQARTSGAPTSRRDDQPPYELRGDTAIVPVSGVLMQQVPWWHRYAGVASTATPDVTAAVVAAIADPRVRSIVLQVDSPGGQSFGTNEAADAIAAAAKRKPVHAVVGSMAASAAYWLIAGATSIAAGPDSQVGSIGTYVVVTDSSSLAEQKGVKVHVVRSGEHKGAGIPGSKVSAEQLAGIQSVVDGITTLFRNSIAVGRELDAKEVDAVSTGQAWLAADALKLGLVDSVEPVTKALSRLAPPEDPMFSKETQDAAAAAAANDAKTAERKRLADLQSAFPKHTTFALEQYSAGATVDQARVAFVPVLERELDEERKARSVAEEKVAKSAATPAPQAPATPAPTSPPASAPAVPSSLTTSGGTKDFMALVEDEVSSKRSDSKASAMGKVSGSNPVLHREWLEKQRGNASPRLASRSEYRRV